LQPARPLALLAAVLGSSGALHPLNSFLRDRRFWSWAPGCCVGLFRHRFLLVGIAPVVAAISTFSASWVPSLFRDPERGDVGEHQYPTQNCN
jgi:hypothetical protein